MNLFGRKPRVPEVRKSFPPPVGMARTQSGALYVPPAQDLASLINAGEAMLDLCFCGQKPVMGYISDPGTGGINEIVAGCTCGKMEKIAIDHEDSYVGRYPNLAEQIRSCADKWNRARPQIAPVTEEKKKVERSFPPMVAYENEGPLAPPFTPYLIKGALVLVARHPEIERSDMDDFLNNKSFLRLFFVGYKESSESKSISLVLLPRNNMLVHVRDCMRAWSDEGGVWANKPEMEVIRIGD